MRELPFVRTATTGAAARELCGRRSTSAASSRLSADPPLTPPLQGGVADVGEELVS